MDEHIDSHQRRSEHQKDRCTISISKEIADSMIAIGKQNQSLDDILRMILDAWNEKGECK